MSAKREVSGRYTTLSTTCGHSKPAAFSVRPIRAIVSVVCPLTSVLFDAVFDREVASCFLDVIDRRRRLHGASGRLAGHPDRTLRRILREADGALEPQIIQAEQSNTSIVFGDGLILKLVRRVEEAENPDLEIGRFLTDLGEYSQHRAEDAGRGEATQQHEVDRVRTPEQFIISDEELGVLRAGQSLTVHALSGISVRPRSIPWTSRSRSRRRS